MYHVRGSSCSLGLFCHTLLREKPGDQVLEVVESPLTKVVGGEHLKLAEQLDKKVRPCLVVGNESSHLGVYGVPESIKDRESGWKVRESESSSFSLLLRVQ